MKLRWTKHKDPESDCCLHVWGLSMTGRAALIWLWIFVLPQMLTFWLVESGRLQAGNNVYFALPLLVAILILPLSRLLAYLIVNRDLRVVNNFCNSLKGGNYQVYFDLGPEKEEEDEFVVLLRNLTRMSRALSLRRESSRERFLNALRQCRAMEEKAHTDPLTGIYNRHYLDMLCHSTWRTDSFAEGISCSAVYIDCDNFKHVNDTLGHTAGDELLRALSRCILQAIREEQDIPLRLGGDEFAVLLPQTTPDQAEKIAVRIQYLYGMVKEPVTSLSIGVASRTVKRENCMEYLKKLINDADSAAYRAKKGGGNDIVCAKDSCNLFI